MSTTEQGGGNEAEKKELETPDSLDQSGDYNNDDVDDIELEDPEPEYFKVYWSLLLNKRCQWCIILCWLVLFMNGLVFGPLLNSQTKLDVVAPVGTASYTSRHKFHDHFPLVVKGYNLLIRFNCRSCESKNVSIDDESLPLEDVVTQLKEDFLDFNETKQAIIYNFTDLYTAYNNCEPNSDAVGEERVQYECDLAARESLVSSDGLESLALVTHKRDLDDVDRDEYLKKADDYMSDVNDLYGDDIHSSYSGNLPLWMDMQEESAESVDSHLYVVPLILVIFGYTTGTWRTALMPFIAFLISISISFMLMYPIARDLMTVSTVAPAIMTSICLAMCIDYNLFLLVRFREEIGGEKRESMRYSEYLQCIKSTLRWSGEVILVSGFILALSMLGYLFTNLDLLRSFGLGCAVAVATAISLNLTLTPTLLLMFPSAFAEVGMSCRMLPIIYDVGPDGELLDVEEDEQDEPRSELEMTDQPESTSAAAKDSYGTSSTQSEPLLSSTAAGSDETDQLAAEKSSEQTDASKSHFEMTKEKYMKLITDDPFDPWPLGEDDDIDCFNQCWYDCGVWTTLMPFSLAIIIATYLMILPISYFATELKIQYAENLSIPRDSDSWATFRKIGKSFGSGVLMNYNVLIPNAVSEEQVWNETYITDTAYIWQRLVKKFNNTGREILSVSGISAFGGEFLTNVSEYRYLDSTSVYHKNVDAFVDPDAMHISYFTFVSKANPNGLKARRLVMKYRPALRNYCKNSNSGRKYKCYMYSTSVETVDVIRNLYQTFPWILLVTMIVVFAICGYAWKNSFLPVRLFLTIALPLVMVFGWAVLVYQYGMLDWLNWAALHDQTGISWIIPLMTITLCFGLALDYDIFLWTRIVEFLEHGVPIRTAVVRAVCKSGNIITAAGVIMALAFGGLFFSTVTGINQAGFLFVVSVLIDTFIIRTSLVPAILAMRLEGNIWHPEYVHVFDPLLSVLGMETSETNKGGNGKAYSSVPEDEEEPDVGSAV